MMFKFYSTAALGIGVSIALYLSTRYGVFQPVKGVPFVPPEPPVLPMDFPRTLVEWRNKVVITDDEVPYYDMWNLPFLIQFFHDRLDLWIPANDCELSPPNNNPRLHDYTYLSDYPGPPTRFYGLERVIHCPARTRWNQDVIIRLISIDGDISGVEHHLALKRLSMGEDSFRGRNHALPVLQELKYEGLNFVVFPMMWSAHRLSWFYDLGEILDFVLQVTEGLTFCHERLVAHLDISYDNILVNFAGGAQFPKVFRCWEQVAPLRSHFPVRYYLNDFEHAAVFSEDSELSDRVISGLPNARWGGTKENFTRRVPPEMENTEPYCPFRADVWSLGGLFQRYLGEHLLQFSKKHMIELGLWDDEAELDSILLVLKDADQTVQTKAANTTLRLLVLFKEMQLENSTNRPLMAEIYGTLQTMIRHADRAVQEVYISIYLTRDDTPAS